MNSTTSDGTPVFLVAPRSRRKAYERIHKLGDKLAKIEPLIDWKAFTPIIQPLYHNKGPKGGRPNINPVVMVKLLVLRARVRSNGCYIDRMKLDHRVLI